VEIPWAVLGQLGPGALVTIIVLMILTGQLVPAKEMRFWREAFFTEQEMRRDLEATGKVARRVLNSLPTEEEK
jgi:hypothetical protein